MAARRRFSIWLSTAASASRARSVSGVSLSRSYDASGAFQFAVSDPQASSLVDPVSNGDEVRSALERILASRGFINTGRLSRLLRHSVEKTLAGETDQLKEYSLGIEVFDRDDKYERGSGR